MRFRPERLYNELSLLPSTAGVENRMVLKACIVSRPALEELKLAGELVSNKGILINTIPILEAQASLKIEDIVTSADRLFQFADDVTAGADPATKEALRYRTASYQGFRML